MGNAGELGGLAENEPAIALSAQDDTAARIAKTRQLPAYRELLESGALDDCGVAQLAGIPVAVPFVSAVAGALASAGPPAIKR